MAAINRVNSVNNSNNRSITSAPSTLPISPKQVTDSSHVDFLAVAKLSAELVTALRKMTDDQ